MSIDLLTRNTVLSNADSRRARVEKDHLFLHGPSRPDIRNECLIRNLELHTHCILTCNVNLPGGSAPVRFGVTLLPKSGNADPRTWTFDHRGGGKRPWRIDLGPLDGIYDLTLWTGMAPDASSATRAWASFYHPTLITMAEFVSQADDFTTIRDDLDLHFASADPWDYRNNPEDSLRRERLLAALPRREYGSTLDIGSGDGFVTFSLPGRKVVGADISAAAIARAEERARELGKTDRITFLCSPLFDLPAICGEQFDLLVITGVLYPHYIGRNWRGVNEVIKALVRPGGIVALCHIQEWTRHYIELPRVSQSMYRYRQYTHCLEVYAA